MALADRSHFRDRPTDGSQQTIYMIPILPEAIERYCGAHSTAPDPLLAEIERYTRAHCAMPQMLTGAHEGRLLTMLVQLSGARRVLEVGTFTGYSALAMAAGLPVNGQIVTCEIDPDHARIARSFFDRSRHARQIEIQLGPALDTLRALPESEPFDFAFLDADKENYPGYYELIVPRLRPGGLLVADNVLWSGRVLDPKEPSDRALVAFNERVQCDPRVENILLPVRDGVMLARKRQS